MSLFLFELNLQNTQKTQIDRPKVGGGGEVRENEYNDVDNDG